MSSRFDQSSIAGRDPGLAQDCGTSPHLRLPIGARMAIFGKCVT
ncbi:hypothetical protein [Novosphingobium sp. PP1Y]|nr:hypothetical protein [Novosphingobium sp. PP1Y]